MRLLALDLATTTGFAFGGPDDEPQYGAFRLHGDIGQKAVEFEARLSELTTRADCRRVVFEAPILPRDTSSPVQRLLNGLAYHVEHFCTQRGIAYAEADLPSVRRHFIGTTKAPGDLGKHQRRLWLKNKTLAECARRGWAPQDDNAGDALAIFSYSMSLYEPSYGTRSAPLFARTGT